MVNAQTPEDLHLTKEQRFATLLVVATQKNLEFLQRISVIQNKGMNYEFPNADIAPIELLNTAGYSLAATFLVVKALGASETDIRELTSECIKAIGIEFPEMFLSNEAMKNKSEVN